MKRDKSSEQLRAASRRNEALKVAESAFGMYVGDEMNLTTPDQRARPELGCGLIKAQPEPD
ncbi:hypothetical protein JQ633_32875 [Bradyrhizobium tropiciagri]|uniref:hypothetical protein n=1 Tax=Bradyrhizobium tropiciagri TaxID=312253 RepID=UPI001BAB14E8|nr:hypothetical protein [Bradyrhizobium tropiciagri]MBR0875193.1 hypothetical protein [Bradyrhizobium tropiciagri]